jgi:hypothetical protein
MTHFQEILQQLHDGLIDAEEAYRKLGALPDEAWVAAKLAAGAAHNAWREEQAKNETQLPE